MEPSPADMLLFATVAREGGFSAAGRRLGISKQSISDRIGALERALGVRLFERSSRALRLTEAGRHYLSHCAAIESRIAEANRAVRAMQQVPTGLLRVTAPVLYGRRFLVPVVAEYLARHAGTRVEVSLADRTEDLLAGGFDLAIRVGHLPDSGLAARSLGKGYVYYVASPDYLRRHGPPDPALPAGWRCIAVAASEAWQLGGRKVAIEPVLLVNDLEMACDAALAGVGIARVPSLVCRDAVLEGRLQVLPGIPPLPPRPVHAVFPSRTGLPAKVRVFLDLLRQRLAPMVPLP